MLKYFKRILHPKPEIALGLDIGEKKVDIVQVEKTASGIRLVNFMRSPLPQGVVEDGLIIDRAVVSKTIKDMLAGLRISSCSIATSVWGKGTIISLKKLPVKQINLKEVLKKEAGDYLTFAGTEVSSDFFDIGNITEEGQTKLRVLHGMSRKEIIDLYVEIIRHAGCEIDSIGLGVLEDLRGLYSTYVNNIVILAIIESSTSCIFLLDKGIITFSYTTDLGSNHIKEKKDFVYQLGAEIDRVITYAGEFERIDSIEKIVLSGDLSGIGDIHLEKVLNEELGVNVEIGNPLAGVDIPSNIQEKELSNITRGLGSAIKAAGVKTFRKDINLLPVEEIEERELKGQIRHFFVGAVVVFLVVILGLASIQLVIRQIKKQTVLAGEILSEPSPVITELIGIEKGFEDGRRELRQTREIIEGVQNKKWSEFLNELKVIIPKTARLTKIVSEKDGVIQIIGEAASQEVVFDFVKNLTDSPYFKDIELKTAKDIYRRNSVLTEYNITGKLYFYMEIE